MPLKDGSPTLHEQIVEKLLLDPAFVIAYARYLSSDPEYAPDNEWVIEIDLTTDDPA